MTVSRNDKAPGQQEVDKLPRHIAVIMDGNNRWSKLHHNNAISGHRAGALAARSLIHHCVDRNIELLTLFVFSSENWMRPPKEVNGLMALFFNVMQKQEVAKLHERNVRIRFIGDRSRFNKKLQVLMQTVEATTGENTGLTVIVAANYGGKWDIVNASRELARKVADGELLADEIDEASFQQHLSTANIPLPDLCIRTGGERRISNFLLWQFAYTEFYFSDGFWPDFDEQELDAALQDYARRQRRYGMISEQVEQS